MVMFRQMLPLFSLVIVSQFIHTIGIDAAPLISSEPRLPPLTPTPVPLPEYRTDPLPRFPPHFQFGAATASYQIEGSPSTDSRQPSIWDWFSHQANKTNNGDSGDIADQSYTKYKTDITLLQDLGVTYYRFSLSWSRIMSVQPDDTQDTVQINMAGIQHYNDLINALIDAKITPFVTLYHWDVPLVYSELHSPNRGWTNSTYIIPLYLAYARTAFHYFGDRVKHWLTFNEPHTFCVQGYSSGGVHAPGRCSDPQCAVSGGGNDAIEPYLCGHSVLLAHAYAADIYHTQFQPLQQGEIGITLDVGYAEPLNYNSTADAEASERYMEFGFAWFADPVAFGVYPPSMRQNVGTRLPHFTDAEAQLLKKSSDFMGVNHYTSVYVAAVQPTTEPISPSKTNCGPNCDVNLYVTTVRNGIPIGPQADSSWLQVVPAGFKLVLRWINSRYNHPAIWITENGVDVPNENQLVLPQSLVDTFRVNFLSSYLAALSSAIEDDGVNVKGYFVWSLLDNFEWADGYAKRFGIVHVDFLHDGERMPKESFYWYASLIENHRQQENHDGSANNTVIVHVDTSKSVKSLSVLSSSPLPVLLIANLVLLGAFVYLI